MYQRDEARRAILRGSQGGYVMSNDNFSGTPATLTGEEISPQLYRTQDAAEMVGIKAAESRTACRIFLKFAGRLNFSPADERRGAKGGSPQKFWTPAQIDSPVIDVDAVIAPAVVTKQFDSAEDSASGIEPAATDTEDSATIGKTDNVVRFQPSTLATLPRDIAPAADVQIDSEPANGIDRVGSDNLRDVFKLILEVNDADKLRRIRDFADARIAALEGKKIMPTGADA